MRRDLNFDRPSDLRVLVESSPRHVHLFCWGEQSPPADGNLSISSLYAMFIALALLYLVDRRNQCEQRSSISIWAEPWGMRRRSEQFVRWSFLSSWREGTGCRRFVIEKIDPFWQMFFPTCPRKNKLDANGRGIMFKCSFRWSKWLVRLIRSLEKTFSPATETRSQPFWQEQYAEQVEEYRLAVQRQQASQILTYTIGLHVKRSCANG